jgi:phospholipid/cholesterol/gamma-HCH transport system substrate-binding protein
MSKSRMEWKVGLFVLIGLILTAAMIMRFSKGTGLSGTYEVNLEARNAGGIIPGAGVLMAGVPVGSIKGIILAPDGSKVTMVANIYDRIKIATNAVWGIATVGLLGDRYISVSPGRYKPEETLTFLEDKATVPVQEAFDIAQVAESASSLMDRLSGTVDQLSNAVVRLDATVLSDQSLSNLSTTIGNLRETSERAVDAVHNVNTFVETNEVPLSGAISNFNLFSANLNEVTAELRQLVATNRANLSGAIANVNRATERADKILAKVEGGEGLAGELLSNPEMAQHVSLMVSNFSIFGSNLNAKGLWGVFRKPKK